MKILFCTLALVMSINCVCYSQDTIYRKPFSEYEALVIKKGYHLLFVVKHDNKIDSIFRYDYGAYLGAFVIDLLIENDKYYLVYGSGDYIGYLVRQRAENNWPHLMGGPLRFLDRDSAKVEAKIEEGGVIKLYETEQGETQAKVTTYMLDFVNKVISKQSDK